MLSLVAAACAFSAAERPIAGEITLYDASASDPSATHKFHSMNDPVMGGQSYSTVGVANGVLNFTGSCKVGSHPSALVLMRP